MATKKTITRIQKELKVDEPPIDHGRLSTGLASVDQILGGGIPKGRIVEIYGPESSGKTTLTLGIIAETQRNGGDCVFLDAEHAIDTTWASKMGVDPQALIDGLVQPDTAEQTLEAVEICIEDGVDLVVVDSVAAMATRRELAGDIGDANVGDKARLMSSFMRRLAAKANRSGTTVIFINQIREKIGVMYGNPEVTPGGRALKFTASLRLDTRKREHIKDGTEIIGTVIEVKCVKNKVGRPFLSAKYNLMYDTGIDYDTDFLYAAVLAGLIEKSGSWYADTLTGEKMGQGEEKAVAWLKNNPDSYEQLKAAYRGG